MTGGSSNTLWDAGDAARATGGENSAPWSAKGVSIDTRTLAVGDLFVALGGPNFDGHDFVAQAAANGAAAAVVERRRMEGLSGSVPGLALLGVDDTMAALQDLAAAARARSGARIIGVTGSVGKTGTKEALRLALGGQGRVSATDGNLNNHWGLPLSLARMPAEADFGIFEMGMNHPGEIAPLSQLARPQVAVITEIAHVHSEFFDSLDAIADAKAEIFTGLETDGAAVLNRDSDKFPRLAEHARNGGVGRIISFGADAGADVRLLDCEMSEEGSTVRADCLGETVDYRLGVPGRHWVSNSLAVLAAVRAAGADVARGARELVHMRSLKGRGERHRLPVAGGEFVLIDESYNASPPSMTAAIRVLAQAEPAGAGRRVAMLGDMLELGDRAEPLHAALAETLRECGIDQVFTAGQHMSVLWDKLPAAMRGGHASTAAKLVPMATVAVRDGDVVMVKGSLGSRMGQVVDALLAMDGDAAGDAPKVVNGE